MITLVGIKTILWVKFIYKNNKLKIKYSLKLLYNLKFFIKL